jgi:hypothetical protein
MPGFMKDVGHAMAALLIQVGDRTAHLRGSERLVERARGYGDTV